MDELQQAIFENLRVGRDLDDDWLYAKCVSCYENLLKKTAYTHIGVKELISISNLHTNNVHRGPDGTYNLNRKDPNNG